MSDSSSPARLKDLEGRGWVRREVVEDRPPRVLYSLTEAGPMVAKMAGPMYLYIRLLEGEREAEEAGSPES